MNYFLGSYRVTLLLGENVKRDQGYKVCVIVKWCF